MTDELFSMLKPLVTVYGMKAINPNTASTDLLKAIDRSMTDEITSAVKARINDPNLGGPFKNDQDFWGFLAGKGANISTEVQQATPLFFEKAVNFKIEALGTSENTTRSITAYVFDPETVSTVVAEKLVKDFVQNQGQTTTTTTTPTNNRNTQNTPLPKGPPRVVYFTEK
jgi:general secretion pathway protein K